MHQITIHKYHEGLTAIEFDDIKSTPEHFVVFIGGVTDGFLTVPYVPQLAASISEQSSGKWSFVQALVSSSYLGFGIGSLSRDAEELAKLVAYLRRERGSKTSKVVLMGHSTGCQDTMEYLTKRANSDPLSTLNGAILQAPISDVEACEYLDTDKQLPGLLAIAKKMIKEGKSSDLLPTSCYDLTFGAPTTAYRFHSLYAKGGDDDYFSSYLDDSVFGKTFGNVTVPLLVLQGSKDGAIPPWVDMKKLMGRWEKLTPLWSRHSRVIEGADHNVGSDSDKGAAEVLFSLIVAFLKEEIK